MDLTKNKINTSKILTYKYTKIPQNNKKVYGWTVSENGKVLGYNTDLKVLRQENFEFFA